MKVCVVQHFDVERRAADHQKGRNSARRTSLLDCTHPTANHHQLIQRLILAYIPFIVHIYSSRLLLLTVCSLAPSFVVRNPGVSNPAACSLIIIILFTFYLCFLGSWLLLLFLRLGLAAGWFGCLGYRLLEDLEDLLVSDLIFSLVLGYIQCRWSSKTLNTILSNS
jgi:hypothetical protein